MLPAAKPKLSPWRSLLFMPANVQRFIEMAPKRNADAIILDLEDSVPLAEKSNAREQLKHNVEFLHDQAIGVVVRINRDLINAVADLEVAVINGVSAIMIPKVVGSEHICLLDEVVSELELKRDLPPNSIQFIALIESIKSLSVINEIAASSPRLTGLALGTEDLSLDGGFEPISENLMLPAQQLIYAARIANINAYGFPASIADYSDIERFTQYQQKAKSMGFDGALCIHPSQIEPINQTYTPTKQEYEQAEKIVNAFEKALKHKLGAVEVDGKMVDLPVYEKSLRILNSI